MLRTETAEVTILGYGEWSKPGDRNQIKYGNGAPAQWVQWVEDDGTVRKHGLTAELAGLNGQRPAPMNRANLSCEVLLDDRDGRTKIKLRVVQLDGVRTPAAAKP